MIDRFCDILCAATKGIDGIYMDLPTANREEAIHRERVYTYELYHQMRCLLSVDPDLRPFMFSGELDKSGHAYIRVPADNDRGWTSCIPDFVLHVPGGMNSNIAVVEVKPANGDAEGIAKDLATLTYFATPDVGYRVGIELVYGGDERQIERFVEAVLTADDPKLRLYWHRRAGEGAQRLK